MLLNRWNNPPPEYPYDVRAPLTKEDIKERTSNVLKYIIVDGAFYDINNEIDSDELKSTKWKTYLYLKKCVNEYRAGQKSELRRVLTFLEDKTNKTWFAKRLLDPAIKKRGDSWGSGNHEWLERSLIVHVIRRSAGMEKGVECETDYGCIAAEIDWLYLQAVIRSPTKYIFFKNRKRTIRCGHIGAVKKDLGKSGFSTEGSPLFHRELKEVFLESRTIIGFLRRLDYIFKTTLVSGKKPLRPDLDSRFVVDGSSTSDEKKINRFRKKQLKPKGYEPFNMTLRYLIEFASIRGNKEEIEDVEQVDSESSEDESI